MAYLWQLWPGRGWPLDAREEEELVSTWAERSTTPGTVRRDALIVALGGLRCGSTAGQLAAAVPGISYGELLASYRHLDQLRETAAAAFDAACQPTDRDQFRAAASAAAVLLPAPVGLLRTTLRLNGLEGLQQAAARVRERARQIRDEVDDITRQLPTAPDPTRLGRLLFDPYNPGLWGDPYFAARRVGELTPVRVRTLLGEEPDSDLIFTGVHDIAPDTLSDDTLSDAARQTGSD